MRKLLMVPVAAMALTVATVSVAAAHNPWAASGQNQGMGMMGQGMMGGPMGGGQSGMMMGPGMGLGQGPGMMGQGFGPGMGPGVGSTRTGDLSIDDVKSMLQRWITWHGNNRLKVGDIKEESDDVTVADIVTQDGSLVDRLRIDRHTGYMQRVQ